MKFTILIFLFTTISAFCQEIKYTLFLKDSCSNKIEVAFSYHLEKDGIKYNVYPNGLVLLPEKGKYKLSVSEIEEEHQIMIDKLINSDTLNLPKIEERIIVPPFSFKKELDKEVERKIRQKNLPTFWICNEKCNGKLKSFYSNGNTKYSGNFKNGLPIGEFKKYYQNGNIKEISVHDEYGFLTKRTKFSENGEIEKI